MTKRTQPFRRTLSKAVLVAVAALALGACGSSTGSSAPKGEPARIRIANGGGASASTLAGGAGAPEASTKIAAGAASADMAMLPFQRTEYVVSGELPTLDGDAPAWHYPAKPTITKAEVASLARSLGLTGDVEEVPADQGGGFRVGAADFSGPVLTVSGDAAASWFYSGGIDDTVRTTCEAIAKGEPAPDQPVSADGSTGAATGAEPAATTIADPNCVQELPKNVPSDDAARDKAADLAKKLGSSPFGDIQVAGDEYGRYASWTTELGDDLANPMGWSAAYGAEGRLVSASGYLVEPQAAAPYPRIGTAAAVKLLQDGTAFFGGGMVAMEGGAAVSGAADAGATDAGVASETPPASGTATVAPDTAVAPPQPVDTPTTAADPNTTMVVETVPDTTLPARQVSITGAKAGLYTLYGVDGDLWLVPAYVFATADGDITVPAIDQSYVEAVNPPVAADDTVGGDASGGGTSGSAGGGAVPPVAKPEPAVVTTVPEPATTTG